MLPKSVWEGKIPTVFLANSLFLLVCIAWSWCCEFEAHQWWKLSGIWPYTSIVGGKAYNETCNMIKHGLETSPVIFPAIKCYKPAFRAGIMQFPGQSGIKTRLWNIRPWASGNFSISISTCIYIYIYTTHNPYAPWCWYIYLQNLVILFGQMLVNIPAPWSIWVMEKLHFK